MKDNTLLIIGSSGELGQEVVKYFSAKKLGIPFWQTRSTANTVVIDCKTVNEYSINLPRVSDLKAILKRHKDIGAIIYLANVSSRNKYKAKMKDYIEINCTSYNNVLREIEKNTNSREKVHIMYASTGSIYNLDSDSIHTEKAKVSCTNSYEISKYLGEIQGKLAASTSSKIRTTSLRLFHIYTPNPRKGLLRILKDKVISGVDIDLLGESGLVISPTPISKLNAVLESLILHSSKKVRGTLNVAGSYTTSIRELSLMIAKKHGKIARFTLLNDAITGQMLAGSSSVCNSHISRAYDFQREYKELQDAL